MKKLILTLFSLCALFNIQIGFAHDKEPPCNHETMQEAREKEGSHRDHFEESDHKHDHHHHDHRE